MTKLVNKLPMKTMIAKHLRETRSISNIEAQNLYRCRALPKRISELKAEGMNIQPQWQVDVTGQRYVRYYYMGK